MHHNVQQTIIEGILVAAYAFVLFIIITSKIKKFENAFYLIFVATGIADVFAILVACFHRLNHELGLGPEFKPVVSTMIVFGGTTFLTHIIGNMLLAFNRYSALRFPDTYDKIWCRRNVRIMILLQYIVAFAVFTQMFGVELLYKENADGRYTFADVDSLSKWKTRYLYGGAGLIYAIISVTLNIKVFVDWRKLSRTRGKSSISCHEKGLLLYTTLVFASTMLMCIQQVLRVIATLSGNNDFDLWVTMQFFWINDVMVCVPPFCLVMLSADLRRDIISFFLCTRRQNKLTPSVSILIRQSTIRN